MLQRQLAPSVVTLAALVEALGPPRWAKALQVLEANDTGVLFWESRRFTVVPDLVLVNATASVACRGSSWTTALALAEGLPQRALQADVFTANIVLSSLAQNKGWQDTLAMLHSLPRRTLRPNTISFNTTMSCAVQGGRWQLVYELLDEMNRRKLRWMDGTFNALASVHELNSSWEAAVQCLVDASKEGLQPSVMTRAVVVSACRKAQQWHQVLALLEQSE
ncbi:Pentatricopeptide repeat-containing protein At2g31400, partial [Durusdinium trenchii]